MSTEPSKDAFQYTIVLHENEYDVAVNLQSYAELDQDTSNDCAAFIFRAKDRFVQTVSLPEGTTFGDRNAVDEDESSVVVLFPDGSIHTLVTYIHQEHAAQLASKWNRLGLSLEWVVTIEKSGDVYAEPHVAHEQDVRRKNFKTMKLPCIFLLDLLKIADIPVRLPLGRLKEKLEPYFPEHAPKDLPLPVRYGYASTVWWYRQQLIVILNPPRRYTGGLDY